MRLLRWLTLVAALTALIPTTALADSTNVSAGGKEVFAFKDTSGFNSTSWEIPQPATNYFLPWAVELSWNLEGDPDLIYVNVCETKLSVNKIPLDLECFYGFGFTAYSDGTPRPLPKNFSFQVRFNGDQDRWLVAVGLKSDMTMIVSEPFLSSIPYDFRRANCYLTTGSYENCP